jgi:hypothetical protein
MAYVRSIHVFVRRGALHGDAGVEVLAHALDVRREADTVLGVVDARVEQDELGRPSSNAARDVDDVGDRGGTVALAHRTGALTEAARRPRV